MIWKLLAQATVAVHALWVAVVVAGPLWACRSRVWQVAHLALGWATVVLWRCYCPLTTLENYFRLRHDPHAPYAEGFLSHYLRKFLHMELDAARVGWALAGWMLLWSVVYARGWWRSRGG